ncbi:MAG: EAL domain-containing protein, partial [Burkholderiaceae bacterium]
RPNGVVVLPLDLQKLNEVLLGVVPDDAVVTVTDRQSDILLRSLEPQVWIAKPGAPHDDKGATEGFAVRSGADRVRRLIAFKVLPDTGWRVAAGVPENHVFAAADAALRNGVLACFGLLLLGFALAWRLGMGILRPLDRLALVATRVAAGETDARAPVHQGANEIDLVADAFNAMLDSLTAADEARRESEENLSITLQSIGDGVIATDPQGCVTRMNAVAERLTGWTLAAATGRPLGQVFRVVNTETRQTALDPVRRVLESGQVIGLAAHSSLLSRDGHEVHIADSAAPIRDAQGEMVGVVLVFSDVSEQYALQRVLVESEARYRALVESSPVGVAVHQQDRLVFCNPMAVKILGAQSQEQLLGRSAIENVHPDDRARVLDRAQDMVTHGGPSRSMELRYLRQDGKAVDVQSQGIAITLHGQPAVLISFLDISARKASERTLRDNEARFRALTELSSDWYWEQDENYRFVRVDGNLESVTGQSYDLRIGKTHWELGEISLTPDDWDQHRALLNAHQEFRDFHLHLRARAGETFWVSVSGTPIFDGEGKFCGYRGVGRDITEQKLAAGQIHALAFYDALTQLPNRRLLIEQLKKAVATHERSQHQAAVLFIDLDNFKTLNDTLGHETGDLLLYQVARRLEACVRHSDTVARFGGDEFVVMLADLDVDLTEAAVQAEQVSHKILIAFDPPFVLAGREHRSTPSIGITLFGKDHKGVEDLLKQADLAMYQAKAAGRNTVRVFDRGMQAVVEARAALEADLREGLAAQQMLLHFQPVVRADGFVTGAEALVRWEHPVRGRVAPGEFIGLAETTRLILPLGQWVLDTACAQLAAWALEPGTRHLTLAVNVSAHQFVEPDFVLQVLQALQRSGADPRRLKLELTESLLAENVEDVIHKMTLLRDRGIDFSLDDFGTGYSSLSYLKRLPLAQLKIDQSFVRDVLEDPNDAAIARTIIALGDSLGLAVIAEGVETEGQHQFLLDIGCNAFQGYLFGGPVAIDAFAAYMVAPRAAIS